jgi:hypoxanthine phosphoribosyltransferase
MHEDVETILLGPEEILSRVRSLGEQIRKDYQGKELVLVSILKGALYFTADLCRWIDLPLILDFMAISSYGDAFASSGEVRILKDLEEDIRNRHVLIVEDIVDTGLTLDYLIKILKLRGPASVKTCSLLEKPSRRIRDVPIDYLGFSIDDHFVVGYGLDCMSRYRHLPYICVLRQTCPAS